jgi:hypothetical protein
MKKFLKISLYAILGAVLSTSCEDDETANVSFVTSYPVFDLTGGEAVTVLGNGSAFVDPGAVATENGTPIDVQTTGTVDTSTPGLYRLTYSATNSDGYSATASRLVAVTAEDVSGTDLSGTYFRAANNRQSTVTKLANGLYLMTDCWGSASSGTNPLPVPTYLVHTGGTDLLLQYDEPGAPFGGNEGTGVIQPTQLSLTVTLIGAAATRTNVWIKM